MTQEELSKFWIGLGANGWYLGELQIYLPIKGGFRYLDPADPDDVRLEVLIKGLHKLCAAADVDCWIDVRGNILSLYGLAAMEFCRASIIAAISKLLKEAENEGK